MRSHSADTAVADIQLNPPSDRTCRLCGRRERWDADRGEWRIASEENDGEPAIGDPFCIHEWDITGTHRPIVEGG